MRTGIMILAAAAGAAGVAALDARSALAQRASTPGSLYYVSGGNHHDWKSGPDVGDTGSGTANWLLSTRHESGQVERVASGLTRRRCVALAKVQFRPTNSCQYFGGRGGFETCNDQDLVEEASCSPT